jgi:prephenate dehydrogenase
LKVGIIGGYGKMGRWFARFLQEQGFSVVISGRDCQKSKDTAEHLHLIAASNQSAVEQSDAVVIAVPIDSFEATVRDIAPFTHEGQLIFDITSVKSMPVEIMHKYIVKGTILGVHPMFGPGAKNITHQRFVLTPTTDEEKKLAIKVKSYLENLDARAMIMSPQEHDELISIVLCLSHLVALVYADTLLKTGQIEKARQVGGTTFRMLLTLTESVLSEDPSFYAALQTHLPQTDRLSTILSTNAREWSDVIKARDSGTFIRRMKEIRQAFISADPEFNQAYDNMYHFLDRY